MAKKFTWGVSSIIVDSREQLPYQFLGHPTMKSGLKTGDYSVTGMEHLVCVERKSQADYWGCLINTKPKFNRDRFVRELERMKDIPWSKVIIECTRQQALEGYYYWDGYSNIKSKVRGETAINSANFWSMAHGVRFEWVADRAEGEAVALEWLQMALRYQRHRDKEKKGGQGGGD